MPKKYMFLILVEPVYLKKDAHIHKLSLLGRVIFVDLDMEDIEESKNKRISTKKSKYSIENIIDIIK